VISARPLQNRRDVEPEPRPLLSATPSPALKEFIIKSYVIFHILSYVKGSVTRD